MKFLKKFILLLLLIFSFTLTGCNLGNTNTPTTPPIIEPSIPVLPEEKPDKPVDPEVKPDKPDKPVEPEKPLGDVVIEGNKATNTKLNVTVYIDEIYNQKEEVALYLVAFKKLPSNYYGRTEFNEKKNTWNKQNLISCTGGTFRNNEGLLPKNDKYIECDIDYRGGRRNALRIVYNNSCDKVYYTSDHYASFVRLYDGYIYDGVTPYA